MKRALLYGLSLALLLSLAACRKSQAGQQEPLREPNPAASSVPADSSTPEPDKDSSQEPLATTAPKPEPERTPAEPAEKEDTRPVEDTKPQEPAREEPPASGKETEPAPPAKPAEGQQQTPTGGGSVSLKDAAEQQGVQVTEQTGGNVWDQAFYDTLTPEQQTAYKNADDATRSQMKGIIEANRQMDQEGYQGEWNQSQESVVDSWGKVTVN